VCEAIVTQLVTQLVRAVQPGSQHEEGLGSSKSASAVRSNLSLYRLAIFNLGFVGTALASLNPSGLTQVKSLSIGSSR
jgi:hypothetical protein